MCAGLAEKFPTALEGSVAVVTPYKGQVALLKSKAKATLDKEALAHIQFVTVDGYQVTPDLFCRPTSPRLCWVLPFVSVCLKFSECQTIYVLSDSQCRQILLLCVAAKF